MPSSADVHGNPVARAGRPSSRLAVARCHRVPNRHTDRLILDYLFFKYPFYALSSLEFAFSPLYLPYEVGLTLKRLNCCYSYVPFRN